MKEVNKPQGKKKEIVPKYKNEQTPCSVYMKY
jgi:hypothetical protein